MSPPTSSTSAGVAGEQPTASGSIALLHIPARLRSHPTYSKRSTLKVADREVADGTWLLDPRNSEFGRTLSDRQRLSLPEARECAEWDPDPAWSARVEAGLPELRPNWDPWDDLDAAELDEEGRAVDVDGSPWGVADLLPLESVEERCCPTAEDLTWYRDDLDLRESALPLYDLSTEVIADDSEHPFSTLTCDSCGDQSVTRLDHCGRALCLPCWRKESHRTVPQVGRTIVTFLKLANPRFPPPAECTRPSHAHGEKYPDLRELAGRIRGLGIRPIVRFLTLTIRGGHDLEERVRVLLGSWSRLRGARFYRGRSLGEIAKIELTWSEAEGWHVHLHLAEVGRFLRDRPYGPFEEPRLIPRARPLKRTPDPERLPDYYRFTYPEGPPEFLREFEPESNLKDEWIRATRGEGSIIDVRTADVHEDPLGFALELSKYVSKPFASKGDGSRLELKDWPEDVRLQLAKFVRGSTRVRWYCPAHSSLDHPSTRRRAPWEGGSGCPPDATDCVTEDGRPGEYRIESVGARRLRFYGCLRTIHAETRDDGSEELEEQRCGKCGKGSLLAPWEVARRLLAGWTLPQGAVWPLPSIHAHKSRDGRGDPRSFDCSPRWSGQAGRGAEGPPASSGFDLALYEEGLER